MEMIKMINNMFKPKSVAIIGASEKNDKWGFMILSNLINSGFEGKIYPINPKSDYILTKKVYKSILDIKDKVDLVVIVVPAKFVSGVMEECGQIGVKSVIIITADFSETGNYEMEQEIVDIAEKYEIDFVGPNTFGVLCRASKLNVSLISTGSL